MFPTWRLKLREVRVAADSGRYEDAIALLERESLCEFLPAKRLAQEVAGKMVARARERFDGGDSAAAWQDLVTADRLGGQDQAIDQLRQQYADRALAEVRRFLAAGEASAALARLEKLHSKGLSSAPARRYQQIAASLSEARDAIEEIIEPFLIQLGFVNRTPRGRMLTPHAFGHLGLAVPGGLSAVQGQLFGESND